VTTTKDVTYTAAGPVASHVDLFAGTNFEAPWSSPVHWAWPFRGASPLFARLVSGGFRMSFLDASASIVPPVLDE
jgi:hypothetical protein